MREKVKGKVYRVVVYESALELIHGMYSIITEIYIPSLELAFNEFHVFKLPKSRAVERYSPMKLSHGRPDGAEFLGEIELKKEDVEKLAGYVSLGEEIGRITRKYLEMAKGL